MKKYFFLLISIFFLIFSFATNAFAQEKINAHLFTIDGCPHCEEEKEYIKTINNKYPDLVVKEYEISKNQENLELLQEVGKKLKTDISGVPFLVIGDKYIVGYDSDETTGVEIENLIKKSINEKPKDIVSEINITTDEASKIQVPSTIKLPFFGELSIKTVSLPFLTLIIALLDGFNPCAMWTLIFLIGLILSMENRKRMWILGAAFIIASGGVYFLFLSAWLNLFLILGFVFWVRLGIGLVALSAGGYYIYDFIKNKNADCKVSGNEKRRRIFEKLKDITTRENFILALGGIIVLAVAVNLVELVCSAGLPAVYTNILAMSNLPTWQYYLYLVFYVLVFMLDDLIVFFVAMFTLKMTGIEKKYSRYSHLIGGIIMLIIGVLLILRPDLLLFG